MLPCRRSKAKELNTEKCVFGLGKCRIKPQGDFTTNLQDELKATFLIRLNTESHEKVYCAHIPGGNVK